MGKVHSKPEEMNKGIFENENLNKNEYGKKPVCKTNCSEPEQLNKQKL